MASILHDEIRSGLLEAHKALKEKGALTSQAKLQEYYARFRREFGPDALSELKGEALLERMHNHSNKDSLVYWLEFKNDQEMPAIFGSIAGGSALKFGIYWSKDAGSWMKGQMGASTEISIDEAVEIAHRNRDQFVAGCKILDALPEGVDDAAYFRLQEELVAAAPDVADSAWGHKYFSLLFPHKLDDYHVPDYQRFHLVKLLQAYDSSKQKGRYELAGRFLGIAKELKIPINHLATILNRRNPKVHTYWRIGTSDGTTARNRWRPMRDGGYVAIGWNRLGDLGHIKRDIGSKNDLKALIASKYPEKTPQWIGRDASQAFAFCTHLEEGDYVLACDGGTVLGIGCVSGGYRYDPSTSFPHQRPIRWMDLSEWKMPIYEGLRTSVYRLRKNPTILVEAERRILLNESPVITQTPIPEMPKGWPARIAAALERKGQVVLYGPPGTGKSFWAERTARELASRSAFGKGFDNLNAAEKKTVIGGQEAGAVGLVRTCCFHPAYGYEDFIEGYRPEIQEGNCTLGFRLRLGIFKALCSDAEQHPAQNYYLIIDEINRGDIPRIFGELIMVMEKSKRGTSVLLPLSATPFMVPPNVFIIGTMNTADRSIALLDTALRRRFGFLELGPDPSVLGATVVAGIPLGPWLAALNRRICDHVGRDARNLQIGHTYLMDGPHPISNFALLVRALREDVLPLLEEYCYEDYDALEKILGSGIVDVAHKRFRDELFDPQKGDQAQLVQNLLAMDSGLLTSPEAIKADEQKRSAAGDDDEENDGETDGENDGENDGETDGENDGETDGESAGLGDEGVKVDEILNVASQNN